jgi:thiamine pyrophosphokinase
MFVIPQVGIFQDYDSPANHAFNATYEVGKSYHLTVGLIGTGGNMMVGATFQLGLYYRDAASNMVFVAATSVTNVPTVFSNNTHFIDFQADTTGVRAGDAWAGQYIGVGLFSTITDTNLEGGYWDLDNVRLTSMVEPTLSNPIWSNNQLSFTIQSEPEMVFEIQKATDSLNGSWSGIGWLTNATGTASFTDTNAVSRQSYYRALSIP